MIAIKKYKITEHGIMIAKRRLFRSLIFGILSYIFDVVVTSTPLAKMIFWTGSGVTYPNFLVACLLLLNTVFYLMSSLYLSYSGVADKKDEGPLRDIFRFPAYAGTFFVGFGIAMALGVAIAGVAGLR